MEQGEADVIAELRGAGLIGSGNVVLEPLSGGVSCDVWKVETPSGPIVVKRPLAQLRVAAEWLAPVERGTSEVRWLRRARGVDARLAPEVLAELPTGHAFAMRFLPGCPVWKDELMAGRVDAGFAAAVGSGIAAVHAATAHNDADRDAFPNDAMFAALRIDPFLLYVADHDAELAPHLNALAQDLAARKIALVHGDVSPKNILVSADGPVILDAARPSMAIRRSTWRFAPRICCSRRCGGTMRGWSRRRRRWSLLTARVSIGRMPTTCCAARAS